MKNKTCGECNHYHPVWVHEGVCKVTSDLKKTCDSSTACRSWSIKPKPTNGDKIRQCNNEELVEFISCSYCIYAYQDCSYKSCTEGRLSWLKAPAESEGNNGEK